jgi:hypothetical protein
VGGDPADELEEAGSARVHDARGPQGLQLLARGGERDLAVRDDLRQGIRERQVGVERLCALGQLAGDGEDGPFLRLTHRGVAGVGGRPERRGCGGRVDRPVRRERLCRAAHELGEDHARVAARAHQARARHLVSDLGPRRGVRGCERVAGRAHGEGHVRPRVPVGYRVDVQVVDAGAARLERGECRADQLARGA